jgi:hypothetical protein
MKRVAALLVFLIFAAPALAFEPWKDTNKNRKPWSIFSFETGGSKKKPEKKSHFGLFSTPAKSQMGKTVRNKPSGLFGSGK